MKTQKSPWGYIFGVLIALFLASWIFSGIFSLFTGDKVKSGNVALIPIEGIIMAQESSGFSENADSTSIVKTIEEVAKNPNVKAIILEINSPGGTPVASDEIATAIKKADKPTVAVIREVGASGAYWIASATDHVIANRLSITGSIGVIGSYLEFSGLLTKYNVTYEQFTGGEFKDIGVPFRKLEDNERQLLQRKIDMIHQVFKDEVKLNRGLTLGQIDAVGEGEFYLGLEAIDLGLIDELGGKDEAIAYLQKELNVTITISRYEHEKSFLDVLSRLELSPWQRMTKQQLLLT